MDSKVTIKNCGPKIDLLESELVEIQRVLMEAREIDRVKLAQALHNGPVQDLYGLLFLLSSISDDLSPSLRTKIEEFETGLQKVVHQLMEVCGELRPPTLGPFGLAKTIRSHADSFQALHPELHVGVELALDENLPENIRIALFRIYKDALLNVLEHAHATHVMIRFGMDADQVFLEIQDDGEGFQIPEDWVQMVHQGSLGIADSMERALSIGGALQINSVSGSGTTIRVEIPQAQNQMGESCKAQPTHIFPAEQMPQAGYNNH
jgi:signal transduction histidine kinase